MNLCRFLPVLIAAVPLALASPAFAQPDFGSPAAPAPAASGGNGEIIVQRGRPQDVSRADAHRQALAITAPFDYLESPLARFEDRLCPGIVGLQTEFAMMMIDRIRDNANQLGIRLHDDGCSANFIVQFSPDSQATMQGLVDRHPAIFQFLPPDERADMLAPGPVHVYTSIELRTRDGMPTTRVRDMTRPPTSQQQMAHSRIYTAMRRDITSVTIVIDSDEVGGMSVGQLADYVTMRGLAQTRPADNLAMGSILSLFHPTGPYPEELTDFDRAYLRALYDWIPNLPAAMKLGNINRELNRLAAEAALAGGPTAR
jgi:hypothetical protein